MAPVTRRVVLLATAAAGLVPLLPGCADEASDSSGLSGARSIRFDHGVASGDPLPDGVVLWTRVTPATADDARPVPVDWQIASDPALTRLVASGRSIAAAGSDFTVKVDVRGLAPEQTYWYRFVAAGVNSPTGRTRTAASESPARLRFAFVTCSHYGRGYYNVFGRIAARNDLQAVIHLGDYIYESGDIDGVRPQVPLRELLTLADYRLRYATQRTDPDLQALHAQHPMIWVWDDHEVANNSWRDGAETHDPATKGPYELRRDAAFRAAHEWLPIRTPDPNDLSRIYRTFRFGDLVDLVMIDARHVGRDAPARPNTIFGSQVPGFTQTGAFADDARQMLGIAQEQWLRNTLAASTARWRILGNQVYFSPLKLIGAPRASGLSVFLSNDKWDGYEPARDRVLDAIRESRNVVILTGDAHEAYGFDVTPDPNNPLAYNPLTGEGSLAVEFVVTSTTTRGSDPTGASVTGVLARAGEAAEQLLRASNPHLRYYDNQHNGYVVLDVSPDRIDGEFWSVPTVAERSPDETLETVLTCDNGTARLRRT